MQTEKEKVIKWLNENCDNKEGGFWEVGSERNGWVFGLFMVRIDSDNWLITYSADHNYRVFKYSDFDKFQEYIITENEKADAKSLIHRLFK